ncbi:hypothetical protein [Salinisphaera shabanensis]|uniref:hypothetical protein n=1 Tax=Salinisphaera shabanensis TaxID=180542 RepID=UPI003340AF0F
MDENSRRLTEIHITQARSKALHLFAFTSTVLPSEWTPVWNELVLPYLVEFGFHARKVNEFCGFGDEVFPPIDSMLVKITEGDPGDWQHCYQYALNALMHANSLVLGYAHADHRQIFKNSKANINILYVQATTDRFPKVSISVYGLVDCFLNQVIPKIKKERLGLNF